MMRINDRHFSLSNAGSPTVMLYRRRAQRGGRLVFGRCLCQRCVARVQLCRTGARVVENTPLEKKDVFGTSKCDEGRQKTDSGLGEAAGS